MKTKKISFFQLRFKSEKIINKLIIGKKIRKICKKHNVKFIVNDDPILANKLNSDGCHLGQKDMKILEAQKILKNKIVGITCHNSLNLVKQAIKNKANYIAIGAFNPSKTKFWLAIQKPRSSAITRKLTKIFLGIANVPKRSHATKELTPFPT